MDTSEIDDSTQYVVELSAPIEVVQSQRIYPGWDITLRGDVIKREGIAPYVVSATPVTQPQDV